MTDRRGWLRQAASLAVLLAGCAQQAPAPAPQAESLRIMTFNIRYGTADDGADAWPHRRDLVIQVIRDGRPDLLGVQEALRFQLDELGAAIPGYGEIGVGRDDGRTKGEYAAFLYRKDRLEPLASGTHWFSDTPEVPGSTSWGNRITRIVTWARFRDRTTGRAFAAYNLHLDHESQPSRERSAEMIARLVAAEDVPVVVLGDFNSGEANPAFRRLTAGGRGTPPPL
ncbi:MAG TPA: endonuclease/exonuclease/phosphatase family protein, partial [Gemmatimonadales bacterium]